MELRVVHYLNQFFAGLGGEAEADLEPRAVDKALGPGETLQGYLGTAGKIVRTIICGDNCFSDRQEESLAALLGMVREVEANLLIAGPAFAAGRYGLACAHLCDAAKRELGLASVTGLAPDNPAVATYKREVLIVPTGASAVSMKQALARMAAIGMKLARGESLGPPGVEGYLPQGFRRNALAEESGAKRALAMLRAKLSGEPFVTEIPLPEFGRVPPAPPVSDLSRAVIALFTTGGLVPKGNPDRLRSHAATSYGRYSIEGIEELKAEEFEAFHSGYYTAYVNEDPNRIVPLDAIRSLIRAGNLAGVHPTLYATTGNGTDPRLLERMAEEVGPELKRAGVGGALITST